MITAVSKSLRSLFVFGVVVWAGSPRVLATDAGFFRVVGPTPTTITAFSADGYITWTDALVGATYTVQTARSPLESTNWIDYIQVPASNNVVTHRLYDPNPPTDLVLIPAGSFTMGDSKGDGIAGSLPLHTVYVSAFYIDRYLVTSNLWHTITDWNGGNGYSYDNSGSGKVGTHPVQTVNWFDVVKWCNARSQKEGLTPCYYSDSGLTVVYKTGQVTPYVNWGANGYRLPTEAEWEKAARGGVSGHRFVWPNMETITHNEANYLSYGAGNTQFPFDLNPTAGNDPAFTTGGSPYTSPVGYFAANGYGLYDMAGNVWEWCWDWYDRAYYSASPGTDPRGPASGPDGWRVLRGSSCTGGPGVTRVAYRGFDVPSDAVSVTGFRCLRGL
jgi:formylglycine-generating enzyme